MKWSLWRAALYGLGVGLAVFVISTMADGGRNLSMWWSNGRPEEIAAYLAGQLTAAPLLFVVVAFIRNRFVKAAPSRHG
jgi:hypothetical protein